jgi:hypothetical protein
MQSNPPRCEIAGMSSIDHFRHLQDPRSHINRRHDLLDIVFLYRVTIQL